MKKIILFIFLYLTTQISFAEIYASVDANGNVTYSDTPQDKNAQVIIAPEINEISTSKVNTTTTVTTENNTVNNSSAIITQQVENKPYQTFTIENPLNQQNIQNQANLLVDVSVEPALQKGDKIQVAIDGIKMGEPVAKTHFEFPAPARGAHNVSAYLFDANGNVLKQTSIVTFYIYHAALGPQNTGAIKNLNLNVNPNPGYLNPNTNPGNQNIIPNPALSPGVTINPTGTVRVGN